MSAWWPDSRRRRGIACGLVAASAVVASGGGAGGPAAGLRLAARDGQAVIPAEMAGGMPFLPVRVAGHARPLWFLVDTGAPWSFLDRATAAALGLATRPAGTVGGSGAGRVPVEAIDEVIFELPGATFHGDEVRVTDLTAVAEGLGHALDGFFGHDLLSSAVVTIDPTRARVTLADSARFTYAGPGTALPLRFGGRHGRWIFVPATLKVPGLPPLETRLLVDTGSADAVNHPALRRSSGPLRRLGGGVGLGRSVPVVAGTLEWVRLGPHLLENVPSNCCAVAEGAEAQLGQGALGGLVAIYDYARHRLILELAEGDRGVSASPVPPAAARGLPRTGRPRR